MGWPIFPLVGEAIIIPASWILRTIQSLGLTRKKIARSFSIYPFFKQINNTCCIGMLQILRDLVHSRKALKNFRFKKFRSFRLENKWIANRWTVALSQSSYLVSSNFEGKCILLGVWSLKTSSSKFISLHSTYTEN